MDLYTLDQDFLARDVIDEFVSAIWAERYSEAGDTQLVVPASVRNVDRLKEGTYLACRGSKEVMQLETQSMDKGLLTVKGKSLLNFLDNRLVWAKNPDGSEGDELVADYGKHAPPGEMLGDLITDMLIDPVAFTDGWVNANLDWDDEVVPFLSLGPIDTSGPPGDWVTAKLGPMYASIAEVAKKYELGVSLYLHSANVSGYSLKFTTYKGLDRTSDQDVNELVRLAPEFETISDIKEVRSIAEYKNVAYVWHDGLATMHLADPDAPEPVGLERRVLLVENPPNINWATPTAREDAARDALANHNYIRAMDGETSPHSDLKYGVDYGLGDIIELEGLTGLRAKARVTEYIRSHDQQGEREYPTISVIGGPPSGI